MTTVGQAKIKFEADTGQVSTQLLAKMDEVLKKVEQLLGRMSDAAEKESKATGDAIATEVERGADKAGDALDKVDTKGLDKVEEVAAKAGESIDVEVTGGANAADKAMDAIDASGLDKVEKAADEAGAALDVAVTGGARAAGAAIDAVDGSSLDAVESAAANAGAALDSHVTAGAHAADAALDAIDGATLDQVDSAAENAAATVGGELPAAAHAADAALDGIDGHTIADTGAAAESAAATIGGSLPAAADSAASAIDGIGASSDQAFDKGVTGAGLMEGALGKVALAIGALAGPMTIAQKGWERLTSVDEAEHKLIALGHTTEEVTAIMDNAMSSVTDTAFGFGDAAGQAATLVAAGIQPGRDLERVLGLVADSASIAGVDLNEMGSIWGKVAASGKLSGQELEMLLDRQIGLLPGLAEMYGVTAEEARKMVSEGKVSFEDFATVMEDMVGGGAEIMGQSVRASFQNVGAAAGRLGEALLKPIFQAAPAFLSGVQKGLNWTTGLVKGFMEWMDRGSIAAEVLKVALIAIGTAGTIGAIVGVVTQLGLVAKVADLAGKALQFLNLSFLMSGPGLIIMAIAAVVAGFVILWNKSEAFRDFWIGLWERISEPVMAAVDAVKGAWDGLVGIFRGEATDEGVSALERLIGADKVAWIIDTVSTVKAVWEDVKTAFTGGDVPGGGALARLVGIDRAERVMEIIGSIRDAWTDLKNAFTGGDVDGGALERIVGSENAETIINIVTAIGDGLRTMWDAAKDLGASLAEVGQSLAASWWETAQAVFSAVADAVMALYGAMFRIGEAIWGVIQALAPVLMPILRVIGGIIVGVVVVAFTVLVGALRVVAGIFRILAEVIRWVADNVLVPLIDVIAVVIEWLVDKFGGAVSGLIDFIRGIIEVAGDIIAGIWEGMQSAWDTVGQPILDFIIAAFQWWWDGIQLGFRLLGAAFEVVWTAMQMAWDEWGQPILDFIIGAFQWWWGSIQTTWDWMKTAWDILWAAIRAVYDTIIAPVIGWIVDRFNAMRAGVDAALELVKTAVQSAADRIRAFYDRYVAPMVNAVIGGFNRVRDTITGWKDRIVGALRGAGSWLIDTGRNIVSGLISGLQSRAADIGQAFLDRIPSWIRRPFMNALGISSPSKVFAGYGVNIAEGLIEGVGSMEGAVQSSTQGLADSAANIDLPDMTAPSVGAPTFDGDAGTAFVGMAESMAATSASVMAPMWAAQSEQMVGLGATMTGQAQGVIAPSWDAMAMQMASTQAGVMAPTMAAVQAAMVQTAQVIATQVGTTIRAALQYLVTLLFWSLNSGVNPVFAGIRGGLQHVVTTFQWAVQSIGMLWAQVREATARPVRFTIQSVFNDGLVGMWNSVSDLLGTKKMGAYPIRFASGGILPGYTPGRDPYTFVEPNTGMSIGLSGGEAIMRPEVARAMGSSWVDGVNAAARMGGPRAVQRYLGGYAGGGVVESISALVRRFWPMMSITSTYRNTPDHHGGGRAVDFSNGYDSTPAMRSATAWFAKNYQPALLELIHSPSPFNIKNGRNVGNGFGFYGAATMNQHRNHVHVAASRPLPMPGGALASVSGDVGGGDMDIAGSFTQEWKDKIATALKGYKKGAGIVDTLPEAVADKLTKAADEKIEKAFMDFSGDPGGGGVERWAPLVSSLLKLYGHPASWLRNTLRRMNQESGGNPRAINLWDSNAAKGIPSKGLMQVIDPTFQAHRDPRFPNDIWDPRANIAASMRYTMRTYGSLPNGYDRAGGYAHGGLMGEGQGWFHKTAFGPERVLSPRQTESFERLVDWIDAQPSLPIRPTPTRATGDGYGRNTKTVLVTQNITTTDPKATADAVEDRLMALM